MRQIIQNKYFSFSESSEEKDSQDSRLPGTENSAPPSPAFVGAVRAEHLGGTLSALQGREHGEGAHYQLAGLKSHILPSGGVWSPLLLLARGEARLPFTVCWPGVGGAFLCFPAGSFLPCYASPSLLRGFERKQALLFPVSYLGGSLLLTLSLGYTR